MTPQMTVNLTLAAYDALLPVATGFVEKSALAFGLGEKEALALTLATEEVFMYLSDISAPGTKVDIGVQAGGYCVKTVLAFESAGFQMKAFNLTAIPSFEDEAATRETGLVLASRLVDRFNLERAGRRLVLTLIKNKAYPEPAGLDVPVAVPLSRFMVRRPDAEELKAALRMIGYYCRETIIPPAGKLPGLLADMFAVGEVDAALAVDDLGHMGGALFWVREAAPVVDCFGPYIFHPESDPEMRRLLMDRCLEEIARTGVVGLISRFPGNGLPFGYFETLGYLTFCRSDGTWHDVEISYRQLGEDKGMAVWAHPDLVSFIESQYKKFTLPREIRRTTEAGETAEPWSLLFVLTDRLRRWAVLRPLIHGEDDETVLADHVRLLQREGFLAIFFEMDLDDSHQAHFTPALLKNDFEPRIVVPYGGKGDLVIFQYRVSGKV